MEAPTHSESGPTHGESAIAHGESGPTHGEKYLNESQSVANFTPLTNDEIRTLPAIKLRTELVKYRDITVAALHDSEIADRRSAILAKQVEVHREISEQTRADMTKMQKSMQQACVDTLMHEKKQIDTVLSSFSKSVELITYSMTEYMSNLAAVDLLVQLARKYPNRIGFSDTVYINMNSESAVNMYPILDDYEYGIGVKIVDAKLKKYKYAIEFCDEFAEKYPQYSFNSNTCECIGITELTAGIDALMSTVHEHVAEFLHDLTNSSRD